MSILLETNLGDLVIDLDVDGSPALCKNFLKLSKARFYTSNLIYNVQPNRFFQLGDPLGDGTGGACIYGILDAHNTARKNNTKPNTILSKRRFLKSDMGRALTEKECRQRGKVVATELDGIANTIGSQLLITIAEGPDYSLDGFRNNHNSRNSNSTTNEPLTPQTFRSVGTVVEDENDVLSKINSTYCDKNGRPYADVRVIRALVIDDPFDDPIGMDQLLEDRGVTFVKVDDDYVDDNKHKQKNENEGEGETVWSYKVTASPEYERPSEEIVEIRIRADQVDYNANDEIDLEKIRQREDERFKREDKSRAVVLEILGDLPNADITAPENVLFVCKINPVTEDEDLELIFSRFDEKVKADIVRDSKTGASLQYAFVEFTTKGRAAEAYFKMDNALVDDRRIKVDFSQSVSKVWDRFNRIERRTSSSTNKNLKNDGAMPQDPFKEQRLPFGRQQHKEVPRRENRYNSSNNKPKNDYRREQNSCSNLSQRHRNHQEDIHHRSSGRERDRNANNDINDKGPKRNDSRRNDRHRYHRDRDHHRDHHRHSISRDCDRSNIHRHSRDDEHNGDKLSRIRKASPGNGNSQSRDEYSRQRRRNRKHDSSNEDNSVSGRSESSGSKYAERYRRGDRDERRRSLSHSRSDDDEKRERKRNEKRSKRKRDSGYDEGRRHRKHEKRHRKHRRHHKERGPERNHRRHSPSSSA